MPKVPQGKYNLKSIKGSAPTLIFLIYRYNDQRLKYSTGLYVNPKHWNRRFQKTKNLNVDDDELLEHYEELNEDLKRLKKDSGEDLSRRQ